MEKRIDLYDKQQTGNEMYRICRVYFKDLDHIIISNSQGTNYASNLSLEDYYNFVRKIPYKQDTIPVEVIGRPLRLVQLKALDCKKKAILIGCYAEYHRIPYRFVAVSSRPDKRFHHVFPELKIKGEWLTFDSTYKNYFIGMQKRTTARNEL